MAEVKIQFCCGTNKPDGWINLDAECDITKPLPFPDNHADMCFCEHGLEHVSGPNAFRFLRECHRILKKDGVVRICVPVLDDLNDDHARDIILNHGHECAYTWALLGRMIELAGFNDVTRTFKAAQDGHWRVIGEEKDRIETARFEGTK